MNPEEAILHLRELAQLNPGQAQRFNEIADLIWDLDLDLTWERKDRTYERP